VVAGAAGKAAEAVTLVLLATLVPRLLGPTDYGRFSVALTVVALGSVALTLGGATLLARYVPAADPAERAATAYALTRRLARNRTAALAGLTVLGVLLVLLDPARFPPLPTALVLLALGLNVLTTLVLQADLGLGRAGPWCARYPVQNAVLIAAVLALHPAAGVTGAVLAIALAGAAGAALAVAVVAPRLRAGLPRTGGLPAGALRFSWLQAGGGALTQLAQRGGVIAVALLAGSAAQTGYAALAIGISLAATYAVGQLFTVVLPVLAQRRPDGPEHAGPARSAGRPSSPLPARGVLLDPARPAENLPGDPSEAALRRLAGLLVAGLVPLMIISVLLVGPAVPLVFGPSYAGATDAFGPALAAVVLAPVNALAVQAAALRLRPEVTLRAASLGVVAFLLVTAALVPGGGAVGATAAALAGAATTAAASIRLLPGAVGGRLVAGSFVGAAAVGLLGVLA
jgi:O-antigen/teichoic acid export membrane protein